MADKDDFVTYDRFSAPDIEVGQKLGDTAFEKAESKYRQDKGMSKSSIQSIKAGSKAYDEAQNEARREASRGVKGMKKGGKVAGKLATRGYGISK